MGRLSARSNPTGLRELERSRVTISVSEIGGKRFFSLIQLNVDNVTLSNDLQVICIARAGNTSQRFHLGSLATWSREIFSLSDLDESAPLRFRLLFHTIDNPKLVASVENLRIAQGRDSESLLPMEPAKLGQLLWRLEFRDSEGPVLLFNSEVFPSAAGIENYLAFRALVLPEALRQVISRIADEPDRLDDEDDSYYPWGGWLDSMGGRPPSDSSDETARKEWCDQIIGTFCERHSFAAKLHHELTEGVAHD